MRVLTILTLLSLFSCQGQPESKYLRWVGDIEHDDDRDGDFQLCFDPNYAGQYFNYSQGLQFEGEKVAINRYFEEKYKPVDVDQSGLIRIRFMVNCKGESGRFRMISSDLNYQAMDFDERITDQLMKLSQSLKGWKPLPEPGQRDYYQYLIFKIENGHIKEIMP